MLTNNTKNNTLFFFKKEMNIELSVLHFFEAILENNSWLGTFFWDL